MLKKNLFVLFNFYFFVIQLFIIGFLWGDYRFFYLAGVNFIFILMISLFFRSSQKEEILPKSTDNISKDTIETTPDIMHKVHYIQKPKSQKKIHHFWFFVLSIFFGFFIRFWLPDLEVHSKLFVAVFISFIIYIILTGLFAIKPFKTWESKLFIIFLIALIIGLLSSYFNIKLLPKSSIDFKQTNNTGENNFVPVDYELTGIIQDDLEPVSIEKVDLDQDASFKDIIKILIDNNDIKLQTSKNVSFDLISYSDPDYYYYRTAYSLSMIGKNLNPDKFPFCETYVVMLGLAQKWSVPSHSNIKQVYRDYAKNNNLLPNCQYGKPIKLKDVK